MWIHGLYLHFDLVNLITVQMNEIEPTRSNPAVFPKIRNMKIATLRSQTPRDVELQNDIVWKVVVSRPRLAFSDTLDESF